MKLGIIGSGKIVHDFLSIVDQLDNVHVTAILTTKRSQAIGEQLAERYQIARAYHELDAFLQDTNVDTVYVAVPNQLHATMTQQSLEAGKNVICEKPFVRSREQALQLKTLAERKGCLLFEAVTTLYQPAFTALQKRLHEIEPIRVVSLNYTQYSSRYPAFLSGEKPTVFDLEKDGGALMDLNSYNLHAAITLLGAPKKAIYVPTIQRGVDTSGTLVLDYPTCNAVLIAAKDASAPTRSLIEGENGSLFFDEPINALSSFTLAKRDQPSKTVSWPKQHRMIAEFQAFATAIAHHDMPFAAERIMESIEAASVLETAWQQLTAAL